ncbi:zinc finger, C4 type [Teladorsagia circumcincta]|uniref:Zinc finger, C4 type n=1 Tax=Teladorsagia circumcincta TaxID=45464 RepID=A0A2G9UEI4_TELCI|nr:zinc finger, C4 type [Teladorsagia circumcincta]
MNLNAELVRQLAPSGLNGLSSESLCAICGDKATGKHYGAVSCDGCKAQRNTCRSCRFDECMRRGMKKEAVQSERDRIRPNGSGPIPDDPLLDALLSAEAIVRQLRSSVITRTVDARRQATTGDVTDRQKRNFELKWNYLNKESTKRLTKAVYKLVTAVYTTLRNNFA